ncbi:glutathione S-transferase N-terminal domain-containing protein [Ruegeria sp. Ofav3-42]|uniref:glutathione S-transferase N-terminal domain-containing protein n=1 Tax=Ruegeria sp. Ofav3-42 TaxID=2917759 RepID=UPI001EF6A5C3|nr:glutathione S-transferase N-terminal domain-containing protein [Ruegeria sp. Ofav3-42]MCG7522504.1 glutathione S-transferase N-terminal domain-containing protein [Ruegeria sp. Ofav3-42]
MELIYVDGSPFARVVRILVHEWRLAVKCTEVSFPLPPETEALTPMGQVPLLLREGQPPLFPTLNIIEHMSSLVAGDVPFPHNDQTRENLVIALSAGDVLAQAAYQQWSGLGQIAENGLGFEPGARNLDRFFRTICWLSEKAEVEAIASMVAAVFLYWARDRGVAGLELADARFDRFEPLFSRPSFQFTKPRPHTLAASGKSEDGLFE